MTKYLVVNADDFGQAPGINQGILEAHENGIVTSASLMVTGQALADAIAMSRDHPALGIGLHWDVWGEDEREFDIHNVAAVRDEFARQLDMFEHLLDRMPTHIDSHRHAHREEHLEPVFREMVEPLRLPLRGQGDVRFVGGFYAQWEWGVTNLDYISVEFLQQILTDEVAEGWTEISCHPGYILPGYRSMYLHEREEEVRTLTDQRIRKTIRELGIRLCNYSERKKHS